MTVPARPADDAHAGFLATRAFGSLDGLRGLSILGVLWHHTMPGWDRYPVTQRGFLGVDLFFVLSGFLITTLLLRERRSTGTISLRGFYVRRILRIFPPYYGLLLVLALVAWIGPGSGTVVRGLRLSLPWAALYVSNIMPMLGMLTITWSLSAEEQFYLVVPALHRWLPRGFPWVVLPVAYLVSALPTFGVFGGVDLPGFFRQTTFGPILLGVGLAHVLDSPRGYRWVSRLVGGRHAPAAALGLVVLAACHPAQDISGWPRLLIQWALVLLLASCVVREDHVLRPMLVSLPLRRLGVVSYGVYLYHLVVFVGVERGMRAAGIHSTFLLFLLVSAGTWAVAELSFRLYESRFIALKARFAGGLGARQVVAAPGRTGAGRLEAQAAVGGSAEIGES